MRNVLLFVILAVGCLIVPIVLASFLSGLGAVLGGVELTMLFALCIAGSFLLWRRIQSRTPVVRA